MAMQGLFLQSDRCPDGIELVPIESGFSANSRTNELCFLSRTDRREPLRLEIQDLTDPVVIQFINAGTDDARIKFFTRFGPLFYEPPAVGRGGGVLKGTGRESIVDWQKEFRGALEAVSGSNPVDALHAINERFEYLIKLRPVFDLAGEGGRPRMVLQCSDLWSFMCMEIAMVALQGAKLATCEHCHDVFLTGSLTGRRSHAKYCSARCRVAAMRARNAEQAKPAS
jgi:hypothetical protein